jgi:hypothetical protein
MNLCVFSGIVLADSHNEQTEFRGLRKTPHPMFAMQLVAEEIFEGNLRSRMLWSGLSESNRHLNLGKVPYYHYTKAAH